MKKIAKNYVGKKPQELQKEEDALRREIAKLGLEAKSNPPKDTNTISKKRKQLAVLLTIKNNQES